MGAQIRLPELLVAIVGRDREERLGMLLEKEGVLHSLAMIASGTARNKYHRYLGVGDCAKALLLSIVPAGESGRVMERIAAQMQLSKPDQGIMFAIPINSVQRGAAQGMPLPARQQDKEGRLTMNAAENNLLMVIMNHGYADDVMDTALEAGAPGGTVLRGHGAGFRHAERFLGITLQPDKDVLMILAQESACAQIMAAVLGQHGPGSEAHAIAFTLPVLKVEGLASLA